LLCSFNYFYCFGRIAGIGVALAIGEMDYCLVPFGCLLGFVIGVGII